ncbi:metallophosphoesterase [Flocculibacter collagenilyticus]|uniref:metallophosphoesterase n=1 Tax=Flocculibacter collagenilyticus TaxID=2744479 RepID=UPI0018F5C32F|nr:metallophosphoesterase [Flocculibacter collagenilyticus]
MPLDDPWFNPPSSLPVSKNKQGNANAHAAKLIQITDLHLFADQESCYFHGNTYQNLLNVLSHIAQHHGDADALIMTGDITQDHTTASYQLLQQTLQQAIAKSNLALPVVWLPGNHDEVALMNEHFFAAPFMTEKYLKVADWHILLCNSKGSTPAGWISEEHQSEIIHVLNAIPENEHAILFCHHHPLPIDGYLDKHILENGSGWLTNVSQYPQVRCIFHGHVHNEYHINFKQIDIFATPATSIQFEKQTVDWQISQLPPAYRVILLPLSKTEAHCTQPATIETFVEWLA